MFVSRRRILSNICVDDTRYPLPRIIMFISFTCSVNQLKTPDFVVIPFFFVAKILLFHFRKFNDFTHQKKCLLTTTSRIIRQLYIRCKYREIKVSFSITHFQIIKRFRQPVAR